MKSAVLRIGYVVISTVILGACSGGGEDEDDGPDTPSTYAITAAISGLTAGGLVLRYSGNNTTVAAGSTSASIASGISGGTAYSVSIQSQPSGQTCTLANANGTVTANVSVTVTCADLTATFTVSGTISGYTGPGLTLRLNGQTGATYNVNPAQGATSFAFTAPVPAGAFFFAAVATQPTSPTQLCTVNSGGSGFIAANITNVAVICNNSADFTVGGTITGLTGTGLALRMLYPNSVTPAALTVAANATTFQFAELVAANGIFQVGIQAQPTGQTCTVGRARGISPTNVSDIPIVCVNNAQSALRGTYTDLVVGVGRRYLNFNADGTWTSAIRANDVSCNTATDTRNGNGVEYGIFSYNSTTNVFAVAVPPVVDTNGQCGLADAGDFSRSYSGTVIRSGGNIQVQGDAGPLTFVGVTSPNPTTSLVGAFVPEFNDGRLLVFHADGTFMHAETAGRGAFAFNSQERGCYSVVGSEVTFTVGPACTPDGLVSYDFNGPYGMSGFTVYTPTAGPYSFTIESATALVLNGIRYRRSLPN